MVEQKNRGNSLVEAELTATTDWLIRLRWVAGAGVLFAALLVGNIAQLSVPTAPLWVIGVGVLLYNLVFFLIARNLNRSGAPPSAYRRLAFAQIACDWLAMMPLIHFSGGIESPVIFFLIFHIVIASILFSRNNSFLFAFLAIALLSGIAFAEYYSLLPHVSLQGYPLYANPLYIATTLIFFSITVLIITFLVTTISERLRRREAEVIALSEGLRVSSAQLQALNESAHVINSTLELEEVLNLLVENTAKVMGVRACSIRLLDETGRLLQSAAVYGLSQAYLDKGPIELDKDPLDRKVLQGNVVDIPDVPQSSLLQYPDWAAQEGFNSMISAPLIGKNKSLGILRAYSDEKGHFTSDDKAFLTAIAAQGSIAIENAMAFQTIEVLDATKSAFIHVFTHELRSPVSVTRSLLQTIATGYAGEISDQQRDIIERAIRRVDFLRKLIDDLLDLATGKIPEGAAEECSPIALEDVIERVVARFEVSAQENSLTLEWIDGTGEDDTLVLATIEGLDRIFNNLVSNAIKYSTPGGKVIVSLARVDCEARITVEDTGIGIPEESMAHLFEEFFRAPNAKAIEREGTGLGLAIVRETVTQFRGSVTVESELGAGTRFTIILPIKLT